MIVSKFSETYAPGMFQKTLQVTDEQTDISRRISPGALARFIGDATMEHNESMGVDYNMLKSHGYLWVLVRTALQVYRLPKIGETISLRSWAGEEKYCMYPRRHEIFSSTGEKIISACSQWMLIDKNTRQLASSSEVMQVIPIYSFSDEPKNPKLRIPFPKELTEQATRTVQASEIDLNGHMNNSYYLDWAMELWGTKYMENHTLHSLWVEYCRELFEGQSVSLHYKREENSLFLRGYTEGKESFSVKLDFVCNE